MSGDAPIEPADRWTRLASSRLLIVLLGLALLIGASAVYGRRAAAGNDFGAYYAASQAVVQGENLYEARSPKGRVYLYPPAMAILFAPLALLTEAQAGYAWTVLAVLSTLASLALCITLLPPGNARQIWAIGAITLVCVLRPIDSNLGNGQANHLVMLFVALAAWLFVRERGALAGAALAVAVSFKVIPVFLAGYFVYKREWRVVAGGAAGLVVLLVLLPAATLGPTRALEMTSEWLEQQVAPVLRTAVPAEQAGLGRTISGYSLRAVVYQYTTPVVASRHYDEKDLYLNVTEWPPERAELLYRVLGVLLVVASLAACGWRRADTADRRLLELSIFVALMIALSPVSRKAHFVTLAVPVACLAHAWVSQRDRRVLWGLVASFALLTMTGTGLIGRTASVYLLAFGALLAGALALWACLLQRRMGMRASA